MKTDKKLLTAAILLPVTVLFLAAALASSLSTASAVGNVPMVQPIQAETYVEIPIEVELQAMDTDNDIVLYQLTEEPRFGTAQIQGNVLCYSPSAKAGKERFSYTAVDAEGNTAQAANITINVRKNRTGVTYSDMSGNPAHYAAICLAENGIMTGESIGGCSFFRPTQTVTRSEFIAMAASIAELPIEPTEQTDFADDAGLSAWAKPFVSTAAANGLVNGYLTTGGLAEIRGQNPITLAEASVIVNNLLTETMDGLQYTLADSHSDMDWARSAISSLDRLDVLSPLTTMQGENDPITRQDACEMLYRTMCLMQE